MKYFIQLIVLLLFFWSSCSLCEKGEGNVVVEQREVSDFDEIEVSGKANVFLSQGKKSNVKVKIDSNLVEYIKTDISGMRLKIKEDKCIEEVTEFEVHITAPNLSKILVDGAAKIKGETTFKQESLLLETKSSGEIVLSLDVEDLETVTKGSGAVKLLGRATQHEIELESAGSLNAFGLKTKEIEAEVTGAGTCKIFVTEKLEGEVSGSGKIFYKGNPKKVKTDVSGSGTIQAK